MKKLISFIFLYFIAIQFSFSQTSFGLKAGGNLANMNFDSEFLKVHNTENAPRIGYQFGMIAQKKVSSKMYLRSELFYSLKGYKLNDVNNTTVGFNYINLPVLVGYKVSPKLSAFFGPQLGLLGPVYSKDENGRSENLKNALDYNTVDLSAGAGLNYSLTQRTSVDMRYNYGFTSVLTSNFIDQSGNNIESDLIKNNQTLELNFNYFFMP